MGNAALMLRSLGHEVCGADQRAYPPMSDLLAKSGVRVYEGYDAARLQTMQVDSIVVGNALSRGNEEIEWLLEKRSVPFTSLPALLGDTVLSGRTNIVVTGTHGKTTTAAMAAVLLRAGGAEPGFFIGGVPNDLPGGAMLGRPDAPFVIEGDEYDSAFFDKRSKFVHYRPKIVAINNLEFDHCDIFRDLRDIQRSFEHLLKLMPRDGCLVVNGDDANVLELLPVSWVDVFSVGIGESNDCRIRKFEEGADGVAFDLLWHGEHWASVRLRVPGLYNARNAAMAAVAVALTVRRGDPTGFDLSALEAFHGVRRRQELVYSDDVVVVIEDFAHHPTALSAVLVSLRLRYPDARIVACFEPRSNTARTKIFQGSFRDALEGADTVFIGAVDRADRLSVEDQLDTARLAAELSVLPRTAFFFRDNRELLRALVRDCRRWVSSPQVVVFFSNGSFGGIIKEFPDAWAVGRH